MISTPNGFIREEPGHNFRMMAEFAESFASLSTAGPEVTTFGSALT